MPKPGTRHSLNLSLIIGHLLIQGLTFLAPNEPETEDTDMVRTLGKWFGFELEFVKNFTPYAQVEALSKLSRSQK